MEMITFVSLPIIKQRHCMQRTQPNHHSLELASNRPKSLKRACCILIRESATSTATL